MSKLCHSPLVVDVTCSCADMHNNMYIYIYNWCVYVCVCVDDGNLNEVLSWKYGYISINVVLEIKMMPPQAWTR